MKYFMDLEVYKNYFLASFKREDGKIKHFEKYEGHALDVAGIKLIISKGLIITFNGVHYDLPVLKRALTGGTNKDLKRLSDKIIHGEKDWNIPTLKINHIDLKEPAPGVMTGLKVYGGRLNAPKLQDLPIEPDETISPEQRELLKTYCVNDLDTTEALYNAIEKQVSLRASLSETYGVDLRSKSDSQIAESIIRKYLNDTGVHVKKRTSKVDEFSYNLPDWVKFKTPEFSEMLKKVMAAKFNINEKGSVILPKELSKAIEFNGCKYKFGIGGLHSQEKQQAVIPDNDQLFGEFDVASMYPSIIIEQGLYPKHLGHKFLKVYSDIKDVRLKAKRSGDAVVNNTYKIVLNGSYGKFGSKYSFLYSPELLIQTTITGQLSLLMLIEKMTLAGGRVVSANTDGVNVLYNKELKTQIHNEAFDWELTTGYELEYTPYLATYNRDVNNYIAVKDNGVKGKGVFATGGLMKNPNDNICIEAVIEYLTTGKPLADTVEGCDDITKFLTVRKVKGGAVWRDQYLGGVVRFYHSTNGHTINYKKNGNKVPNSDGCAPLMDLPDSFPKDLDFNWYISESQKMLGLIGANNA